MRNKTNSWLLSVVFGGLLLSGCGGDAGQGGTEATDDAVGERSAEPTELTIPEPMRAFEDDGNVAEIRIEGDDRMTFDTDRFTVAPGQMVRLTLVHVGSLPAQSMGHNVVILQTGENAITFGIDASEQGSDFVNDFVPESVRDRILALTALIGGGQSAVVEFKAPEEPGEYAFLCSFPGHFGQMNGFMEVRAN
ncbi:MAG: plastocyanin/azurin family copper-binding protein [Gemmatimonadota bacterium]